jgi:hypothetical protein
MLTVFFALAVIGTLALLFFLVIELNELEKRVTALVDKIKKHYEAL